jgi:hypothetical protein
MPIVRARRAGTPERRGRPGANKPWRFPLTLAELITAIKEAVALCNAPMIGIVLPQR